MENVLYFWFGLYLLQVEIRLSSTHTQECPVVMDIAFMIDASGSLQPEEFETAKAIIKEFTSHFTITRTGAHLALMSFADTAHPKHSLKDKQDVETIQQAVDSLLHPGGGTNLAVAFREAHNLLSSAEGGRTYVPRVLIVATDGQHQNPDLAASSSKTLKDDGIVIISLGIGENLNRAELEAISSSNAQVLLFPTMSVAGEMKIAAELAKIACAVIRKPEVEIFRSHAEAALKDHVITTMYAWDEMTCAFKCLDNRECFSFNFNKGSHVCELNHSNKRTSPTDFMVDTDSMYYEMVFN